MITASVYAPFDGYITGRTNYCKPKSNCIPPSKSCWNDPINLTNIPQDWYDCYEFSEGTVTHPHESSTVDPIDINPWGWNMDPTNQRPRIKCKVSYNIKGARVTYYNSATCKATEHWKGVWVHLYGDKKCTPEMKIGKVLYLHVGGRELFVQENDRINLTENKQFSLGYVINCKCSAQFYPKWHVHMERATAIGPMAKQGFTTAPGCKREVRKSTNSIYSWELDTIIT
jgi:hypothetical protein